MDWQFSFPSSLSLVYWGATASAAVFVSLSICQQATGYTSRITIKLALLTCFTLWTLFRACTSNLRFLYQNGIDSLVDFLAIARSQYFGNPSNIDKGQPYHRLGLRERTLDWWWKYQACSFMVGTWNIFLVTEGQRHGIKFLWAFLLLGETVSVPLASNLFYLALVLSPKESQRREVFASPYLYGTTVVSLYILSRLLYIPGAPTPQTLAFIYLLPYVSLLQPVPTYPAFSLRRKWLYHFVHVVSAAAPVPALVSTLLAVRPTTTAHDASVYSQWFTSIYTHLQQSPAAQDLLCTSISFAGFIITSGCWTDMLSAAYLVLGMPFLNATSALALGVTAENSPKHSPSVTPLTPGSPLTLLKRIEIYEEDAPNEYHFLWTKESHIFYATVPAGPYELSELVGTLVPIHKVYPPWRASVQEARDPFSAATFVKYPYGSIILKLLDDTDAFSLIDMEIDILQQLAQAQHPNIVEYLGCLRRDDLLVGICLRKYPCSLSELVEGKVAEDRRPPYDPALILSGVKAGLSFIHDLGLVHDDINPENIMIDENGRAIIIDFDACRPVGAASRGGTPGWATNPTTVLVENDDYGLNLLEKFMQGEYAGDDYSLYDM